jgi:branched-chain amino acid transport system ATP-binding protein
VKWLTTRRCWRRTWERRHPVLKVEQLSVKYGAFYALRDVSLTIEDGNITTIAGANGAGKTTLINTISGVIKPVSGRLMFENVELTRMQGHEIASLGVVQVPEGRKLFPEMTVYENLMMGGYNQRARPLRAETMETVFQLFPVLRERSKQSARTLSGGEQQMLAIGRAMMAKPRLLMFDEPSLGLAPLLVREIFSSIEKLKSQGLTILLVEQNIRHSLQIADYAYVLETGQVVLQGTGREVMENEHTKKAYLGL